MATIKSFTDLEQSCKLAEFLPLESADAFYDMAEPKKRQKPIIGSPDEYLDMEDWAIPCWSLAALLNILPKDTDIVKDEADTENEHYMCTVGIKDDIIPAFGKNPIDACVDMIEKLHELNLL